MSRGCLCRVARVRFARVEVEKDMVRAFSRLTEKYVWFTKGGGNTKRLTVHLFSCVIFVLITLNSLLI